MIVFCASLVDASKDLAALQQHAANDCQGSDKKTSWSKSTLTKGANRWKCIPYIPKWSPRNMMYMFTHIILTIYPAFPKKWWTFQPFDLFMCRPAWTHRCSFNGEAMAPLTAFAWRFCEALVVEKWNDRKDWNDEIDFIGSAEIPTHELFSWYHIGRGSTYDVESNSQATEILSWASHRRVIHSGHTGRSYEAAAKNILYPKVSLGAWVIWDIFWRCLETLHCFRILQCHVRPSLAQKVHLGWKPQMSRKNFSNCCNPSKNKKHEPPITWGYDFGAPLRLWQLRLLCETAVKLTIQAQNHAKATGKTLWGHLIKLERLILGILGIIHVRSCGLTFSISHEFFWS